MDETAVCDKWLTKLSIGACRNLGLGNVKTGYVVGDLVTSPRRVGHPLRNEVVGLWSARRGPYRVIYEIDDDAATVTVVRIDHQADVYRRR